MATYSYYGYDSSGRLSGGGGRGGAGGTPDTRAGRANDYSGTFGGKGGAGAAPGGAGNIGAAGAGAGGGAGGIGGAAGSSAGAAGATGSTGSSATGNYGGGGGGGGGGGAGSAGYTSSSTQAVLSTAVRGGQGGAGGVGGTGGASNLTFTEGGATFNGVYSQGAIVGAYQGTGAGGGGGGGGGGHGGAGAKVSSTSFETSANIVGGAGGAGGSGGSAGPKHATRPGTSAGPYYTPQYSRASAGSTGNGGDGGNGLVATSAGPQLTIDSTSTVRAGAGGAGVRAGYGGAGVSGSTIGLLTNKGTIAGGLGGTGSVQAGRGGAGVTAYDATVNNYSAISGGRGGSGGLGSGGEGLAIRYIATVTNSGTIKGGSGFKTAGAYNSGGGGLVAENASINNAGTIQGGAGYFAGAGGAGINATFYANLTNVAGAKIYGGAGGAAFRLPLSEGAGADATSYGGAGGAGVAAYLASIKNTGNIVGGVGGKGGYSYTQTGFRTYTTMQMPSTAGAGVSLSATGSGGQVANYSGGMIIGGTLQTGSVGAAAAGVTAAGYASIVNSGTIQGGAGTSGQTSGAGIVEAAAGGEITNLKGGLIAAGNNSGSGGIGIAASLSSATILNAGIIRGGSQTSAGSTLPVGAGIVGSNLTIVNEGLISGGATPGNNTFSFADAVTFTSGTNYFALGARAGQKFPGGQNLGIFGAVDVQAGTLTFDQTLASGQLAPLPTNAELDAPIIGAGAIVKTASGTLTLTGASTFSGGTTINAGTLDLAVADTFVNGTVASGGAGVGAITFAGSAAQGTELTLESGAQTIGGTFGNTLTNFGANNYLDLRNFAFTGAVAYAPLNGTLVVMGGTNDTQTETFALANGATAYTAMSDGAGGTLIDAVGTAAPVPCFVTGTAIRVVRNGLVADVPVEDLVVGDLAVTASGAHRQIRWLGSRQTHCRRHPRSHESIPVRIAAHAFGPNRPARDLLVSPGHSLCVDVVGEVLIPAVAMVNGTTITQEDVDHVTYWHVELESHDILLAENMPAESYLEMGNRGFFADSGVVKLDASPDAQVVTHADFCRPFHAEGALVEVVRAQLAARAEKLGWRLEAPDPGEVHLMVDGVRVAPCVRDLELRFLVPADAKMVWLVSGTAIPRTIDCASPDGRDLGLCLERLVVDEGFSTPREIVAGDERFCVGFHPPENSWRWTTGRALLPADLWAGTREAFFLRAELHCPPLPRWVAPAAAPIEGTAPLILVG